MSSNTDNVLLIKFGFMPDGLVCGHDDGEDRHLLLDVDGLEASKDEDGVLDVTDRGPRGVP
jgi:hypothetical protein